MCRLSWPPRPPHVVISIAQQAFAQGGASQEQRDRLLQTTDRLDGQSRRLEDSKRTMMEIEDTGETDVDTQASVRVVDEVAGAARFIAEEKEINSFGGESTFVAFSELRSCSSVIHDTKLASSYLFRATSCLNPPAPCVPPPLLLGGRNIRRYVSLAFRYFFPRPCSDGDHNRAGTESRKDRGGARQGEGLRARGGLSSVVRALIFCRHTSK